MDVRKVGLGVAAGGVAVQVVGFVVDGQLHASDPSLASREAILTLSNLGHLLIFLGLAAIFVGIVSAFFGPRLYQPTLPRQTGRRLAQLSAPLAAMALVGGLGVAANASSLGAVHSHDHRPAADSAAPHIPGDHDNIGAAGEHGAMDHGNAGMDHGHADGAMDHANDDGSTETADGDHANSTGMDHGHSTDGQTHGVTVGLDHAHTMGITAGHRGDHGNSDPGQSDDPGNDDHGNMDHGNDDHASMDHGNTDTTTGDHHGDHGNTDTTTGDHHGDHDHTGTTTGTTTPGGHDHDHGTTTSTTPGSTDTTQPHDHDHGTTTSTTPGSTDTTQPHDHDHTGTTLPGSLCTNGAHDHGHVDPVPLDPATKLVQDAQLAEAKTYAEQYPTAASAMNAGYVQVTHYLCGIGAHYMKLSLVDETFNPAEPEILLYDGDGPFANLVGVNYYVGRSSRTAPDGFAGPNDQWHQHIGLCLNLFFVIGPETWTEAECTAAGGVKQADGGYYWLLHAWVVTGYEMPNDWFKGTNPVLGPGPWDFPGGVSF